MKALLLTSLLVTSLAQANDWWFDHDNWISQGVEESRVYTDK